MAVQWLSLKRLYVEEKRYGSGLKVDRFHDLCVKYDFAEAVAGWVATSEVTAVPNFSTHIIREGKPDIRDFFSRYYSFKTRNEDVYWVVSPQNNGWTKERLEEAFKANDITCDIMDGIAGDYTIVFKPRQLVDECNNYVVGRSKEKINKYALRLINFPLSINREVSLFDTEKEALAFKAGMDFAREVFHK